MVRIRYNNDVCSQIVHLMFVECSIYVGYNISKKSKGFLFRDMVQECLAKNNLKILRGVSRCHLAQYKIEKL